MTFDTPMAEGTMIQLFLVGDWALDLGGASGTGLENYLRLNPKAPEGEQVRQARRPEIVTRSPDGKNRRTAKKTLTNGGTIDYKNLNPTSMF